MIDRAPDEPAQNPTEEPIDQAELEALIERAAPRFRLALLCLLVVKDLGEGGDVDRNVATLFNYADAYLTQIAERVLSRSALN